MKVLMLCIWKPAKGGIVTHVESIVKNSEFNYEIVGYPRWAVLKGFRALAYILNALVRGISSKYHVIHAHYVFPQGFAGVILKKLMKKPLVLTVHGSDLNVFASNVLGKLIAEFVIKNSNFVCAVSMDLKKKARQLGAQRVEVVYGAPKVEHVERKPSPGTVLFVGSCSRQKGLDVLLRAFPAVRERVNHARLVVVGCRLNKQIEGVEFVGYTDRVQDYYSMAEVVVIPSLQEGLSLVALEALAAGIPVVASNTGGLREILRGKGILVEPGDHKALAQAIVEVLTNSELREKLSKKQVLFTGKALAEKMENIYRRVLNE